MKLKLSQIKSNPFHDGKYNSEQIKVLEKTIQEVGFMGALPVFKKKKDYYLVFGHHRKKACENILGKDAKIEVTVQKFNDDEATWGMVVENITQDKSHEKVIKELVNIRNYLKKQNAVGNHDSVGTGTRKDGRKLGHNQIEEIGSSRHIEEWLNRNGRVILSHQDIADHLTIYDNLNPKLYKQIETGATNKEGEADKMNWTNALLLARATKDKEEQEKLHEALQNSNQPRMHRVRTRQKVITKFKEVKKKAEEGDKEAKKSIEMIFQKKKDIADLKFNSSEFKKPQLSIREKHIEFQDLFKKVKDELPDWEEQILPNLSLSELERFFYSMSSWSQETFSKLIKDIIEEIKNKDKNKKDDELVFTFEK